MLLQSNTTGCGRLLTKQLDYCERALSSEHPLAAKMLAVMARLHLKQGHHGDCERLQNRVLGMRKAVRTGPIPRSSHAPAGATAHAHAHAHTRRCRALTPPRPHAPVRTPTGARPPPRRHPPLGYGCLLAPARSRAPRRRGRAELPRDGERHRGLCVQMLNARNLPCISHASPMTVHNLP